MGIDKTPNKGNAPTPSSEIENQRQKNQEMGNVSNPESDTITRASSRKSRLNKTLQKGHKQ